MTDPTITVLTHGGAGSDNNYADGTLAAARTCEESIRSGAPLLQCVSRAVAVLEDDSRFNAGVGSHPRSDGSVEMDAAVMDSEGRFGAVAALKGFQNPVHVAHAVTQTPYRLLAGSGAAKFAAQGGFKTLEPGPETAKGQDFSTRGKTTDTVGCVAFDGKTFAAGLSTGGIDKAIPGRVGDVPLIGCGLYAGEKGAVAATGSGEAIAMNLTAIRAYQKIEQGEPLDKILKDVLNWFQTDEAFGILIISREGSVGGANRSMAWSTLKT